MRSHVLPAICLGPTGNFQGSYHFFNLLSSQVIKRHAFVELPAPQSVINRVTTLALKSGVSRELTFANRNHIPFSWSTHDTNRAAESDPTLVAPYPDIPAQMLVVLLECHLSALTARVTSFSQPDPDWTQLADEATENADLRLGPSAPGEREKR